MLVSLRTEKGNSEGRLEETRQDQMSGPACLLLSSVNVITRKRKYSPSVSEKILSGGELLEVAFLREIFLLQEEKKHGGQRVWE